MRGEKAWIFIIVIIDEIVYAFFRDDGIGFFVTDDDLLGNWQHPNFQNKFAIEISSFW